MNGRNLKKFLQDSAFFYYRKSFHILSGLAFIWAASYLPHARLYLGLFILLTLFLDVARNYWSQWNSLFLKIFSPALKPAERSGKIAGATTLWVSLFLIYLLFPLRIFRISASVVVLADPFAAVIGKLVRSKKIVNGKSVAGSLGFFAVSFLVLWGYWNIPLIYVLLLSIILCVFELVSPEVMENFLISFGSAAAVALILGY